MVEHVVGKRLFHINRPTEYGLLAVEQHLTCGDTYNPFFKGLGNGLQVTIKQSDGSGRPVSVLGLLRNLAAQDKPAYAAKDVATTAASVAGNLLLFSRELLWELVRLQEFPDAPSRLKCFWLVETIQQAHQWMDATEKFQIVEIEATGVTHAANGGLLPNDTTSFQSQWDAAQSYWRGNGADSRLHETLFCGEAEVVAIHGRYNLD